MDPNFLQIIALFFANAALVVWLRGESREDWRHCDALIAAIHEETKDFHGRLCKIETKIQKDKETE